MAIYDDEGVNLFGFQLKRSEKRKKSDNEKIPLSFVPPKEEEDGTGYVINAGGYFGQYVDLDGGANGPSEYDLIIKYRDIAQQPEVDQAINDIVEESIVSDYNSAPVELVLDNLDQPDRIKKIIMEEFENIVELLDFSWKGSDVFRNFYIDGRLYYHKIIDEKNPKRGLLELRYIDPLKIKKVKEVIEEIDPKTKVKLVKDIKEYFVFQNENLVKMNQGLKISKDAITYVTSGAFDPAHKRVLSYLHKAIKPVNQLRMMEDSLVIYRLARAPERRIFYIDVGNLPKAKAEEYMRSIMSKYRNKMVYDAMTGEMRDDRKHMCLAMDTKVPLLDGRTLTLNEISNEFKGGKTLWVYSCDPNSGKFEPGLITFAGVTRKNAEVMKITLDNGKSITCTPDHKFPVWNKGFVRADKLIEGESMIPHYTRKEKLGTKTSRYEQIFENSSKEWVFTHRAVSRWKDYHSMDNEYHFDESYKDIEKGAIHHVNINPLLDNTPENLVRMDSHDRFKMHGGVIGTQNQLIVETPLKYLNSKKDLVESFSTVNVNKVMGKQKSYNRFNKNDVNRISEEIGMNGYSDLKRTMNFRNHKIIKIEKLNDRMDTGCLTIDGNEIFHNHHTFALDAGIYTKNSMLEDFWLPRKEGGRGTEITTLSGGENLGQIDDIMYFQQKLYRALNVPTNRLEPDAPFSMGRATEITRDELRFQKFINRLRKRFSMLFMDLLKTQLMLKGIVTEKEWKDLAQKINIDYIKDNHFSELKSAEIMQDRLRLLGDFRESLGKYYSHEWIRKNVLMQNDEEIEKMIKQIEDEKKNPLYSENDNEGQRF